MKLKPSQTKAVAENEFGNYNINVLVRSPTIDDLTIDLEWAEFSVLI